MAEQYKSYNQRERAVNKNLWLQTSKQEKPSLDPFCTFVQQKREEIDHFLGFCLALTIILSVPLHFHQSDILFVSLSRTDGLFLTFTSLLLMRRNSVNIIKILLEPFSYKTALPNFV